MFEEQENNTPHIMQAMVKARDDAQMSYGPNYKRQIIPFKKYIQQQMLENDISSEVEMAVIMIQDAENQEENPEVLIMNILAGAMECVDPS